MRPEARWQAELTHPTEGFFEAFRLRLEPAEGLRDGVREAVKRLVPAIDWDAYLPHFPHGILGVRAVLALQPLLSQRSFLRAMATQLHMLATEGRRPPAAQAQVEASRGSGTRRNLEGFIAARRPGLAFAEAQGVDRPSPEDFQHLATLVAQDMANVGHKLIACDHLGDLQARLGQPRATGRRLLGLAAWLAATPEDTFWARRAAKRLGEPAPLVAWIPASLDPSALQPQVREVCDLGLVATMDGLAARLRAGQGATDTLAALVLAACEKQLDARSDLEGKTAWNFVFLATLVRMRSTDARLWCQAAALVNLFPTDEPEGRVRPRAVPSASQAGLLEAILDSEAALAMGHAEGLLQSGPPEPVLGALAEAATRNDPTFNHAHQLLAVAAAAELVPHLPDGVVQPLLVALAKNLANSQGSGDLGLRADRALADHPMATAPDRGLQP